MAAMREGIAARVVAAVLVLSSPVRADHAPGWLTSRAKPETTLAGITVGETTVGEVVRRFGKFQASKHLSEEQTETEYSWHLPRSVITVSTMHAPEIPPNEQTIIYVEARQREGTRSRVRTGAGVVVGSDFEALVRAYGPRYMTSWRKLSDESSTITFIFSNETELSAGFSDSGQIISLMLGESQE